VKYITGVYQNFVKSVRHSLFLRSFKDFYSHNTGFTLIEILVTLTILAALATGMVLTLNPKEQIDKAENASRINNLKEIKNAIQLYYDDNKCYPSQNSSLTQALRDGGTWQEDGVIYMQRVPKENDAQSIVYLTDSNACPQWNVVFSKLANEPEAQTCPLVDYPGSSCVPSDYGDDPDHPYACTMSGAVNCEFISNEITLATAYDAPVVQPTSTPVPGGGGSNPTSTPVPGGGGSNPTATTVPTPTPTQTVEPLPGGIDWYDTSAALPDIKEGYISPYPYSGQTYTPPALNQLQYFDVKFDSPTASPVTSVALLVVNDTTNMTSQATQDATATRYNLSLLSGTSTSGTWGGLWQVGYSLTTRYKIIVLAYAQDGSESRLELPFYGYYEPGQ